GRHRLRARRSSPFAAGVGEARRAGRRRGARVRGRIRQPPDGWGKRSMKHSEERILTTHAGSLIRAQSVVDFDTARGEGHPVDEAAYASTLGNAVDEVVRQQARSGVDVVDDGEFSKSSWGTYINSRVSGFARDPERDMAINYTGKDSERFAEFFESQGRGG